MSLSTSAAFRSAPTLAASRFNVASFWTRIGSYLSKMGSSEVLRAMLRSVTRGTVLQMKVNRLPVGLPFPSSSAIQVPRGLRSLSSAFNSRSW